MRFARILFASMALTATLCAADPFVGTWKMNPAKSEYKQGTPPKEQIATITVEGNEMHVHVAAVTAGGRRAGLLHNPLRRREGEDVRNIARLRRHLGTHIGPNEREISRWKDGKVVFTARSVVSPDGNSMSTFSKGVSPLGKPVDAHVIYDKLK